MKARHNAMLAAAALASVLGGAAGTIPSGQVVVHKGQNVGQSELPAGALRVIENSNPAGSNQQKPSADKSPRTSVRRWHHLWWTYNRRRAISAAEQGRRSRRARNRQRAKGQHRKAVR